MKALSFLLGAFWVSAAHAHGGGLNAEGCHNNRKTGDYHCHAAGSSRATPPELATMNGDRRRAAAATQAQPGGPTCFTGPRGGTYTITKSGHKNYSGC